MIPCRWPDCAMGAFSGPKPGEGECFGCVVGCGGCGRRDCPTCRNAGDTAPTWVQLGNTLRALASWPRRAHAPLLLALAEECRANAMAEAEYPYFCRWQSAFAYWEGAWNARCSL